jgi:hypothetical protein
LECQLWFFLPFAAFHLLRLASPLLAPIPTKFGMVTLRFSPNREPNLFMTENSEFKNIVDGSNQIPPLQSLEKFLTTVGKSRTTGYRWRQLGYLKTVVICGRLYISGEAVKEFLMRAAAGEFSRGAK